MRLRQIHVINVSPMLDRIMAILRPFMRKEVAKLVSQSHLLFKVQSVDLFWLEFRKLFPTRNCIDNLILISRIKMLI